jgi:hypothetical protein
MLSLDLPAPTYEKFEFVKAPYVVLVAEREVRCRAGATKKAEEVVTRGAGWAISYNAHLARVVFGKALDNSEGVIAGPVVGDDESPVPVALRGDGVQLLLEIA